MSRNKLSAKQVERLRSAFVEKYNPQAQIALCFDGKCIRVASKDVRAEMWIFGKPSDEVQFDFISRPDMWRNGFGMFGDAV